MSYQQLTITAPPLFHAPLIALVMRLGSLGVVQDKESIDVYFPSGSDLGPLEDELTLIAELLQRSSVRKRISFRSSQIPDRDWNKAWKEKFVPIRVGRKFTILPPWEKAARSRIPLVIDPGMAFGTGHHETTRSCLLLMERYAATTSRRRFLDLGTGSGLLALAAQKLGFREVIGVDTDQLAIKSARRNRRLNGVKRLVLREGGLEAARGEFDMIAANLISGTLIELAGKIRRRTAQDGLVIMSGILRAQESPVAAAARKSGFRVAERLRDGKWVSLLCRR